MNIFLHELKAYRKSTLIWTFSMAVLVILLMMIYPSFANDMVDLQKLLSGYPTVVIKALGLSDIFTLLGFYSFVFMYIMLCGAIQGMNMGASIISKEVRQKTADFLLTKPITRAQIVTAKLLATVTLLGATAVVYITVASLTAHFISPEPFDMKKFLLISLTVFFLQIIFMALGVLISVIIRKIKSVISLTLSTVFGFFILSMFESVIGDKVLRYLTPFKYFDPMYIIKNGAYEISYILVSAIFVIVAIAASYWLYVKKDIHAV